MAINKVICGNNILVDLTADTAVESDVASGKTFHKADGTQATGTASGGGGGYSGQKNFIERDAAVIDLGDADAVGAYACFNNDTLEEVSGSLVETIGSWAFGRNNSYTNYFGGIKQTNLKKVNFPNLNEIEEYAFYYCSKLDDFVGLSGNSDLVIDKYAFANCSLANVDRIDAAIIQGLAFSYCSFAENGTLKLGDNIEYCKNYAFYVFQNSKFKKVIIGGGSKFYISSSNTNYRPFYSCTYLTQVNIPGMIDFSTTNRYLFYNCSKISDIYVSWSEGDLPGAPWGASSSVTIHYNTVFDADGEVVT